MHLRYTRETPAFLLLNYSQASHYVRKVRQQDDSWGALIGAVNPRPPPPDDSTVAWLHGVLPNCSGATMSLLFGEMHHILRAWVKIARHDYRSSHFGNPECLHCTITARLAPGGWGEYETIVKSWAA